ncbi:hypothetical protein DFJ73DRAFT_794704 [Zopfochytrium polystomum]|nr:hypothetical protein DFJ73DRAFT_794704 [Zopfochytrium polystomum]
MDVKDLLKAARKAIAEKRFPEAEGLCEQVIDIDARNFNAHVFLGVALQNLERLDESEAAYRTASGLSETLPPAQQALACQGLVALFEKSNNQSSLARALREYLSILNKLRDETKFVETSLKLVDLLESRNEPGEAVTILLALIPGAESTPDFLTKEVVSARQPELELLWRAVRLAEQHDQKFVTREVEIRRRRLGADTFAETTRKVESEAILASQIRQLLDHIKVKSQTGADLERFHLKAIDFNRKLLFYSEASGKAEIYKSLISSATTLLTTENRSSAYEILLSAEDKDIDEFDQTFIASVATYNDGFAGMASRAYLKYREGDLSAAEELIENAYKSNKSFVFTLYVYSAISYALENFEAAGNMSLSCLKELKAWTDASGVPKKRMNLRCRTTLGKSYHERGQKYLQDSLREFKIAVGLDETFLPAVEGYGLALQAAGFLEESKLQFEKALQISPGLETASSELGWIQFLQKKYEDARETFARLVKENGRAQDYCRLACVHWHMGGKWRTDKASTYSNLLQAIKMDPSLSLAYTYLALYFEEVENDRARARKCYEKAFTLNSMDEKAGLSISRYLLNDNKMEEAKAILQEMLEYLPKSAATWNLLGLANLQECHYQEAIVCFQSCLRNNSKDPYVWECLAECYLEEGKYTAALKASERAAELNSGNASSSYFLLGSLRMKMGLFADAVQTFELVENNSSMHMLSLQLGVQCLMDLAREHFGNGAFGLALSDLNNSLAKCLSIYDTYGSLQSHAMLKMTGDVFMAFDLYRSTHTTGADLMKAERLIAKLKEVARPPLEGFGEFSTEDPHVRSLLTMQSGASWAYSAAAAAASADDQTSLLVPNYIHDLAISLLRQSETLSSSSASEGSGRGWECQAAAIKFIRAALGENQYNDSLWNALGLSTSRVSPSLAQHAFITALEINSQEIEYMANLGSLSLMHGDFSCAESIFNVAVLMNPASEIARIGQTFAGERSSGRVLDLFENALEIGGGFNYEFSYSYAFHVYQQHISKSSEKGDVNNLASAAVALSKCVQNKKDAAALTLLALIDELLGKFDAAYLCAREAVEITESVDGEPSIFSLQNFARLCCSAERFSESVAAYESLLNNTSNGDGYVHVGCGMAHFFNGDLPQSLLQYQAALDSLAGMDVEGARNLLKGAISVSLSQVLFYLGSEEHLNLARQQLLECATEYGVQNRGLMTLLAFAILVNDSTLAESAAAELMKLGPDSLGQLQDDAIQLLAEFFRLRGDLRLSRRFISRSVHNHPTSAKFWAKLCEAVGRTEPRASQKTASVCHKLAKSALVLGGEARELTRKELGYIYFVFGKSLARLSPTAVHKWMMKAAHLDPSNSFYRLGAAVEMRRKFVPQISGDQDEQLLGAVRAVESCAGQSLVLPGGAAGLTHAWARISLCEANLVKAAALRNSAPDMEVNSLIQDVSSVTQGILSSDSYSNVIKAAASVLLSRSLFLMKEFANSVEFYKNALLLTSCAEDRFWEELGEVYRSLRLFKSSEFCLSKADASISAALRRCLALGMYSPAKALEALSAAPRQQEPAVALVQMLLLLVSGSSGSVNKCTKLMAAFGGPAASAQAENGGAEGTTASTEGFVAVPWLCWLKGVLAARKGDSATAWWERELALQPSSTFIRSLLK